MGHHSGLHSKTFILNIKLWDRYSAQNHTHFEYWPVGSTFSSAFGNIGLQYGAMRPIFSSAFNTINTLNIELWDRHYALKSKTFILKIELCDRYSTLHSKPYTLWISCYGIDIQLFIWNKYQFVHWGMRSTLSSAFNTIHISNIE